VCVMYVSFTWWCWTGASRNVQCLVLLIKSVCSTMLIHFNSAEQVGPEIMRCLL
jgi:hypothetical protein